MSEDVAEQVENGFDEYARKIWQNEPYVKQDRVRWHSSGYHIKEGSLNVGTAIEDAHECLDISPSECQIGLSMEEWEEVMDDPRMIGAMARLLYSRLKRYGRYAFDNEPDWEAEARRYMGDY